MSNLINSIPAWRLIFVLPCLAVIAIVNRSLYMGTEIPVPFILVLLTVMAAGTFGGLWAGLLSGLASSAFLIHTCIQQLSPSALTGSWGNTLFACFVFTAVGVFSGRLKDQQQDLIASLTHRDAKLRKELSNEIEEKETQTARVRNHEQRLQRAVRVANIGHFTWDVETGTCLYCSDLYAANFGLTSDEFIERSKGQAPFIDFIHRDDRASFEAAVAEVDHGTAMETEYRVVRADGTIRFIRQFAEPIFDDEGRITETVGCTIDLTNLRETEARLRQSQRIEAIGTLTGGVAHDFNNLLAVIMGNIELTMEGEPLSQERVENLNEALTATRRGADLSQNLLSFARRAHLDPSRVNLNEQIQTTTGWALRVLPENISIETSFMAGLWDAELDVTSLGNAVINLLLNARDAMHSGGQITIETANMRIGPEYISDRFEDIKPGRYVLLAVTDTGHGIPANTLEKIFDPFYTEKPVGKGSGLGLSMVQGFMKQSGGAIRVYSEVGVGTTFKLYFKAAPGSPKTEILPSSSQPEIVQDTLEILMAEDESAVSRVLRQMLLDAGHHVHVARNGDTAYEAFQAASKVDLLITDIVMPGKLQGPALANKIRSIDPELPCIFVSGYASEATVHGNGLRPSDIRLMKPVSKRDLMHAITQVTKAAHAQDA